MTQTRTAISIYVPAHGLRTGKIDTKKILYLDRAYWGDPDCVSVHWLEAGEKVFTNSIAPRQHPDLQPMKYGKRVITLCDYGENRQPSPNGEVRRHPSNAPPKETLAECLARHDVAIGGRSTAMVDAAIAGLRVFPDDPCSPVSPLYGRPRQLWVNDLAWHNWNIDEIKRGKMWAVFQ